VLIGLGKTAQSKAGEEAGAAEYQYGAKQASP
jgi:hypothetical protein